MRRMDTELHDHDHARGLAFDVSTLLGRRRALKLFAGAGVAALAACGSDDETASSATRSSPSSSSSTSTTGSSGVTSTVASGETIPEETAGPYPGDGSNGPNVLTESGVVRSDITPSFAGASGVAAGVPLTISLAVTRGGNRFAGAAAYLWHCDREGRYSMYSSGVTDQNYLRGVQEADTDGRVTLTSIFPGAYSGRWPHIHFEVYPSLDEATSAGDPTTTSQIALPEETSNLVYETDGYEQSVSNMSRRSLQSDMVFSDGADLQTPSVSGTVGSGFTIDLAVPV
jgi:protocatechuate 3,4-dioxygenase beta subunit